MKNKRICKQLIGKILHIHITKITFPETEKQIDVNYDSKSVRLDVYVHDDQGRIYDIEMQCSNNDNELPKRTRYYQAMIDMAETEKGQDYQDLKESYIIFICTFDPFKQGYPIYTFRNLSIENKELELEDKTTKIFLNSKGKTETLDTDIAAFLKYVNGKAAEGTFTKRKRKCLAEGLAKGEEKVRKETILNLAQIHMPKETIAQVTRSNIAYVEKVIQNAGK